MSERIHNINACGDVVEWGKSDLGNEWSQVVEYMCKDLKINYEVYEPDDDDKNEKMSNCLRIKKSVMKKIKNVCF